MSASFSSLSFPLSGDTTPLATVQALYAAFGRMDIPAFLALLSPNVDWRFVGAPGLAYSRRTVGREGVQCWLQDVISLEDIQVFEPGRFFHGDDYVTVWGWERSVARATARPFECEWVHVFEVENGQITRFSGMYEGAKVAAAHAAG